MSDPSATVDARVVVTRIAAALLGGYAFCWGLLAFSVITLYGLGMPFEDAEHLSAIIVFLVFAGVFCWAFAARSLRRVWLVLAGGGALLAGAASLIQLAIVVH